MSLSADFIMTGLKFMEKYLSLRKNSIEIKGIFYCEDF